MLITRDNAKKFYFPDSPFRRVARLARSPDISNYLQVPRSLAQFVGGAAPFDSLEGSAHWTASHGDVGTAVPPQVAEQAVRIPAGHAGGGARVAP